MKTVLLALGLCLLSPSVRANTPRKDSHARQPILLVMNRVVNSLMPKILAQKESPRVTAGNGIFGVGRYQPRGGEADLVAAPPLRVIPTPGLGVSLNVDPVTGHLWPLY
ncbi:MAG TPA: hypothetical protein VN083_04255 [Vicinamibacteria bacterium]|jgi:hypothetical protein|nr:hypothetical protein [Vicinamibacteria bacterium]